MSAGQLTPGRKRVDVDAETNLPPDPQPGDYWFAADRWWCMTPSNFIGNLGNHTINEYEDGTITVSPSILVTEQIGGVKRAWHGFLERGVWREA
jgi:hypothetical protein